MMISAFISDYSTEFWHILTDAAPYVLFGFLAAGLLKALLPEDAIAKHLGNLPPAPSSRPPCWASRCRSAPAA